MLRLSRFGSIACPAEFRRGHEDYYISRLESPWNCSDSTSSLIHIPVRLVNLKAGHVFTVDPASGLLGLASKPTDADRWTYRPGCDSQQRSGQYGGAGGVELTHLTTGTTAHLAYQADSKLLTGQARPPRSLSTGLSLSPCRRASPSLRSGGAEDGSWSGQTRRAMLSGPGNLGIVTSGRSRERGMSTSKITQNINYHLIPELGLPYFHLPKIRLIKNPRWNVIISLTGIMMLRNVVCIQNYL